MKSPVTIDALPLNSMPMDLSEFDADTQRRRRKKPLHTELDR